MTNILALAGDLHVVHTSTPSQVRRVLMLFVCADFATHTFSPVMTDWLAVVPWVIFAAAVVAVVARLRRGMRLDEGADPARQRAGEPVRTSGRDDPGGSKLTQPDDEFSRNRGGTE